MTWIIAALGMSRKAAGAVGRYPLQCALAALLCIAGWQAWRISVVKQSLTTAIAARLADRAEYERAQRDAQAKAVAQRDAIERQYRSLAHDADANLARTRVDADTRLAAYVGRMRAKAACVPSSGTIAPAESGSAGVSQAAPADAVLVEDLKACNGAAVYARAAFEWAKGLAEAPDSNRPR